MADPRIEAVEQRLKLLASLRNPLGAATVGLSVAQILSTADAVDPLRAPGMLHIRDDIATWTALAKAMHEGTGLTFNVDIVRAALRELAVSDGD